MKIRTLAQMAIVTAIALMTRSGWAQVAPTAVRQLEISAFGAGTGTWTGIEGGKNLAITAGADLTFLKLRLLRPSIEVRGSYPVDTGTIDAQKNVLVGPKVEHSFGRLRPYADFFVGRGEIDYQNGGIAIGDTLYISSISTVYAFGGGVDYDLTRRVAVKGDVQYQHWDAPVVAAGTVHPVSVSLGVLYRFNFDPRNRGR